MSLTGAHRSESSPRQENRGERRHIVPGSAGAGENRHGVCLGFRISSVTEATATGAAEELLDSQTLFHERKRYFRAEQDTPRRMKILITNRNCKYIGPGVAFLAQPYTPATLAREVRELLDKSD